MSGQAQQEHVTAARSDDVKSPEKVPQPPDGGFTAWSAVFAGWLLFNLSWGPSLSYGAFQEFYQSKILAGYGASEISWIGTTYSFFLLSSGAVMGPFFDRGYFFPIVATGCFLNVFGFMMLSLSTEYYQIFLSQGVCLGLGSGVVYLPCTSLIATVFTEKRPLAMALMVSGIGIGGVLYPIMFARLVPEIGFAWTMRTFGFISLLLASVSLILLSRVPRNTTRPRKLLALHAFTEVPFTTLSLAGFLIFVAYYIPFFYMPAFAGHVAGPTSMLTIYVLSILNAGQTLGRLAPAFVVPRIGAFPCVIGSVFAAAVVLFGWAGVDSTAGFIVWVLFYGFFTGALITAAPLVCAHPVITPQLSNYGTRWGLVTIVSAIGSLVGAPIAGALADPLHGRFFDAQMFAGAVMTAGGIIYCIPWSAALRYNREMRSSQPTA